MAPGGNAEHRAGKSSLWIFEVNMIRRSWLFRFVIVAWFVPVACAQGASSVRTLVDQLNQARTTDRAMHQLVEVAKRDADARSYLAQQLPGMIDKEASDEVWLNAVRLSGILKVSQAVPSLHKALSRGRLGGSIAYSMTAEAQLDDDAVGKALSQVGDLAIPALKDLLQSSNRISRRRGVRILCLMNTRSSRKLLRDQLSGEADAGIIDLINQTLQAPSE